MKKIVFIIFVSFVLVSCRKTYDFSNLQEAQDAIVSDLQSKKIIFIGENHNNIYPMLFVTKYLEVFYDAGLRYIFLEGKNSELENINNIYKIIPPWINSGWKYEEHIFEEQLISLNKKYEKEPIRIIFPEKNFIENFDYSIEGQCELLNKRDEYVQSKIIQIMEDSKENEKAIVFYGCNHGNKTIQKFYDLDWKATGVYLDKYYGTNFVNYRIDTFYDSNNIFGNFGTKDCVVVSDAIKYKLYNENCITSYERLCITKNELYGVPYCYIPTKENINVLLKIAQTQITSHVWNQVQPTVVGNDYMQFLLAIYYLKYYFGDDFSYTFENDLNQLQLALEKIVSVFNQNQITFLVDGTELNNMETYSKYLFSYGMIEEYLNVPNQKYIENIIYNLKQAKKINQHDIWPQYWISYFYTEKALISQKESDYKKALDSWNELLKNDLLFDSPVLKITYDKIAICAAELNMNDVYQRFLEKGKELKFLEFDCKDYKCFGY